MHLPAQKPAVAPFALLPLLSRSVRLPCPAQAASVPPTLLILLTSWAASRLPMPCPNAFSLPPSLKSAHRLHINQGPAMHYPSRKPSLKFQPRICAALRK